MLKKGEITDADNSARVGFDFVHCSKLFGFELQNCQFKNADISQGKGLEISWKKNNIVQYLHNKSWENI